MTIKELKEVIEDLPDDFVFQVTVCKKEGYFSANEDSEIKKQDFDVGYSDKVLTLFLDITDL